MVVFQGESIISGIVGIIFLIWFLSSGDGSDEREIQPSIPAITFNEVAKQDATIIPQEAILNRGKGKITKLDASNISIDLYISPPLVPTTIYIHCTLTHASGEIILDSDYIWTQSVDNIRNGEFYVVTGTVAANIVDVQNNLNRPIRKKECNINGIATRNIKAIVARNDIKVEDSWWKGLTIYNESKSPIGGKWHTDTFKNEVLVSYFVPSSDEANIRWKIVNKGTIPVDQEENKLTENYSIAPSESHAFIDDHITPYDEYRWLFFPKGSFK